MKKSIIIGPRDRLVFEHLAKFQTSTKPILKLAFFEGRKMKAVDSMLRRLDSRGIGYLYGRHLPNSKTLCYRLTKKGAKHLGIEIDTQPIPILRLFVLMGRAYFINRTPKETQRALCTDSMLAKFIACKDLESGVIRPPRVDFYISQTKIEGAEKSENALGAILPDLNANVRRVADRVVNHCKGFIERGFFHEVMRAGRFELAILTGHQAKKNELQEAATRNLQRRLKDTYFEHSLNSTEVPPVRVKVEVIPELANLRLLKRNKKAIRDSTKSVPRPRKDHR